MKTVDVTTRPGLKSGAKTALAALTVGAAATGTAVSLMPNHWVDIPSVFVGVLLVAGAGYGLSRIDAGVSDTAAEGDEPRETADEETESAEPEPTVKSAP